jgi:hypothetical protein
MSSFVNSKHEKLSQEEIIAIAAKETGSKYSAEQIKASLTAEAYQMKALMLREGNTIFVVHPSPMDGKIAQFRAINADTIPNYLHNSLVFTKAVGLAGFKVIVTQFSDASLLNIFKYVKRHAPFPNMGYKVQKAANGDYIVTVNLGNTHKGGLPDHSQPSDKGAL